VQLDEGEVRWLSLADTVVKISTAHEAGSMLMAERLSVSEDEFCFIEWFS
jgi:hypothetical protein